MASFGDTPAHAGRVQRLQGVAGSRLDLERVLGQALAGDFDPAQYDAAMASAFGEDYYEVCASSFHVGKSALSSCPHAPGCDAAQAASTSAQQCPEH